MIYSRRVGAGSNLEPPLERVRQMAYNAARRRIRDHHLAEDVAQEVTEEFSRRRDEIRDPNRWIPAAARRLAARRLAQHRQRGLATDMQDPAKADRIAHDAGPVSDESARANRIVMKQARRELPAGDRQILEWYYLSEIPLSEIAANLDCTEHAAQKRLQRARARAKSRWGDDEAIRVVLQRR